MTNRTSKIIIFILFFMLSHSSQANQDNQDQIQFDNIQISKPNDRWRVNKNDFNAIELKYLQHGNDIIIRVMKGPFRREQIVYNKVRTNHKESRLKQALLESYQKQGFQFYKYDSDGANIYAEGINSNRQYLLLKFLMKVKYNNSNMIVVESILNEDDYLTFKHSFEYVCNSITTIN